MEFHFRYLQVFLKLARQSRPSGVKGLESCTVWLLVSLCIGNAAVCKCKLMEFFSHPMGWDKYAHRCVCIYVCWRSLSLYCSNFSCILFFNLQPVPKSWSGEFWNLVSVQFPHLPHHVGADLVLAALAVLGLQVSESCSRYTDYKSRASASPLKCVDRRSFDWQMTEFKAQFPSSCQNKLPEEISLLSCPAWTAVQSVAAWDWSAQVVLIEIHTKHSAGLGFFHSNDNEDSFLDQMSCLKAFWKSTV